MSFKLPGDSLVQKVDLAEAAIGNVERVLKESGADLSGKEKKRLRRFQAVFYQRNLSFFPLIRQEIAEDACRLCCMWHLTISLVKRMHMLSH